MHAEPANNRAAALPGALVGAGWLADHVGDVTIVDVRWYLSGESGRRAYERGHLPGALFVDLDTDLSAPASALAGRHPLPTAEAFAHTLGRLGIDEDRPVVAYDDASGSVAARMWWLLRSIGQPGAVLDGGIGAWPPHELSTDVPISRPVRRAPRSWRSSDFVDADATWAMAEGRGVVLDARSPARFGAGDPAIDPRPGHIPGACNVPWADNLDPHSGRFLASERLRARYLDAGVSPEGPTIAYCGSGVTACHDLLALELAGFTSIALYPGSWSAWGADLTRPAATEGA